MNRIFLCPGCCVWRDPLLIMITHCSCSKNLFLTFSFFHFFFPTFSPTCYFLPSIFLSLWQFLCRLLWLSGTLCMLLLCHVLPALAPFSKLSAMQDSLQIIKIRNNKNENSCERPLKAQGKIRITSAQECVHLLPPCVLAICLLVTVASLNRCQYFLPSWYSERVRKIFWS